MAEKKSLMQLISEGCYDLCYKRFTRSEHKELVRKVEIDIGIFYVQNKCNLDPFARNLYGMMLITWKEHYRELTGREYFNSLHKERQPETEKQEQNELYGGYSDE